MEAAALMGAHKTYKIPGTYNDGYRAMGDAVAVPVSRYLAEMLLSPLAKLVKDFLLDSPLQPVWQMSQTMACTKLANSLRRDGELLPSN
jgi:hypothetical protein